MLFVDKGQKRFCASCSKKHLKELTEKAGQTRLEADKAQQDLKRQQDWTKLQIEQAQQTIARAHQMKADAEKKFQAKLKTSENAAERCKQFSETIGENNGIQRFIPNLLLWR